MKWISFLYHFWQILLNILFCIIAFIFFVPITITLIPFNFFFNKGPIFYTQVRVGKQFKTFRIIKYRTILVDDKRFEEIIWPCNHIQRVTILGKLLRRFRIDELPQFINVILLQINLIGPRPERPEYHDLILKGVPQFTDRLKVKPGITGHAQVIGGYSNDIEGARRKLELDLKYINEQSMLFDIKILYRTSKEVLRGTGI